MFSNLPSAPVASSSWPKAEPKSTKPRDHLIFNLSLSLRQRVTNNLNSFSQLLHGKQLSKSESDELAKESQSLVVQLMSLRVRSNEDKLLARINENGERPTFTVAGPVHTRPGDNVLFTATSNAATPFGTRLVSELTWSNREQIVSSLLANYSLTILNKEHLTHDCKMELLRVNDELVRLLSSLPTGPTTQPADKPEESPSDAYLGDKSELERRLAQRDSQLEFRLNEIVSGFEKDKLGLSGALHNVQTRLALVESGLDRLGSKSEQMVDERIKSFFPCTFKQTGRSYIEQEVYNCKTCNFVGNKVTCKNCIAVCHRGHETSYRSSSGFCDCGSGEYRNRCELNGKS